jgi:hypothetical protein
MRWTRSDRVREPSPQGEGSCASSASSGSQSPAMEGPFAGAKGNVPTTSFALSAVGKATSPATTRTRKPLKETPPSACGLTAKLCSSLLCQLSVSPLTSVDALLRNTTPTSCIYAPYAAANPTPPLRSYVEDIRGRIITPYNADAYDSFLERFNLTDRYPTLVFNLRHGFSIGNMPSLTRTHTPKNHKSAVERPQVLRGYCNDEVKLSRMSGLS